MYGTDKDSVVVNGLLQCLVDIGNEVGVPPEEQLNGALEIIAAIHKLKDDRDVHAARIAELEEREAALAASLHRMSRAIGACMSNDERKFVFDSDDYKELENALDATFSECLARRDALKQAEGMEGAAMHIRQKALDYDSEHGATDPSTGAREYPGDGAEYFNEMMELADEIRQQADEIRQQAEGHQ